MASIRRRSMPPPIPRIAVRGHLSASSLAQRHQRKLIPIRVDDSRGPAPASFRGSLGERNSVRSQCRAAGTEISRNFRSIPARPGSGRLGMPTSMVSQRWMRPLLPFRPTVTQCPMSWTTSRPSFCVYHASGPSSSEAGGRAGSRQSAPALVRGLRTGFSDSTHPEPCPEPCRGRRRRPRRLRTTRSNFSDGSNRTPRTRRTG
jgi:hypothetical protein